MGSRHGTLRERFEAKYVPEPMTGCWLWTAGLDAHGYARIHVRTDSGWRPLKASRVAWLLYRGPIPYGLQVNHRCDTPACVNPDHLWLGTQRDNLRDMCAKKRDRNSRKTHCPRGHEFTPENTYIFPSSGSRGCRICIKAQHPRQQARRREREAAAPA